MIGAIIGDIVGSRFEWNNIKTKEFEFFSNNCFFTDDSIMSLAIAKALLDSNKDYNNLGKRAVECMQEVGRPYPLCGYGTMFKNWMYSNDPKPYNSFGNGAAMRVSACGYAAENIDQAMLLSSKVTIVTHNHPEAVKGAEAVAVAIYLARIGKSISEIKEYISVYYYPMNFTLDSIRENYSFDVTCQGSVPQALMAFFESKNFEDAIRNAISIGGDSDTIAAIAGGIAEAYYGVPLKMREKAIRFLDKRLISILSKFENKYGRKIEERN